MQPRHTQLNGSTQWQSGRFSVTLQQDGFAQIVESIRMAWIQFRGFFQMFDCRFQISSLQLAVAELVKDRGIAGRMLKLFLILCDGFHIAAETRVGEPEMIVA